MKVLILTDHFATGGGAGEIARVQAEDLAKNNDVLVLAAVAPPDLQATNYQIRTFALPYAPRWRTCLGVYHRKAIKILQQQIRKFQPEICYAHNINVNWSYYSLKVLAQAGVKTILTFHDVTAVTPYVKLCKIPYRKDKERYMFDYRYSWLQELRAAKLFYNPFRRFFVRKYVAYASDTRAVSQALADFLQTNRIRVDKVIHNRLPDWPDSQVSDQYDDTIFFGGRLSSAKGALEAVKYLGILKDKFGLRPKLLVAGRLGVITERMEKLAVVFGVAEQLVFLGWLNQEDYRKILQRSGVVIVPSICFDSFPTVVLEALRAARPVVATIFGGAVEIVENSVNGFLADPRDLAQFSGMIAKILQDKQFARSLGASGRARFIKEFSLHAST